MVYEEVRMAILGILRKKTKMSHFMLQTKATMKVCLFRTLRIPKPPRWKRRVLKSFRMLLIILK